VIDRLPGLAERDTLDIRWPIRALKHAADGTPEGCIELATATFLGAGADDAGRRAKRARTDMVRQYAISTAGDLFYCTKYVRQASGRSNRRGGGGGGGGSRARARRVDGRTGQVLPDDGGAVRNAVGRSPGPGGQLAPAVPVGVRLWRQLPPAQERRRGQHAELGRAPPRGGGRAASGRGRRRGMRGHAALCTSTL